MAESAVWGCRKCAALGKTCCQKCEVLVTAGDVARIRRRAGGDDFWERRPPADPSYLDQPDDPNWVRWTVGADGLRTVLRRDGRGGCTFLATDGCALPMEIRPLICRLYPYTYTEAGINGVNATECPGEVIPPGSTILKVLDMRLTDAVRWHRMLYAELEAKEAYDESRTDVRLAG